MITSSQNSKFKELKKLVKTKNKSSDEFFLVEGAREIEKAIQNKFIMSTWIAGEKHSKMIPGHNIPTLDLAQNLYSQLVLRSDEPLALFYRKKWLFSDFEGVALKKVLILDHVEKPGNIGAMLRTSVAFDFDLTIITGVKVDLYNSNIIRNSLGHVFDKPVILSALDQALTFLTQKKVKLFGAVLDSSSLPIEEIALTSKCYGLGLGAEDRGIDPLWYSHLVKVAIPMHPSVDSLNVSVACGVFCYGFRLKESKV